VLEGQLRAAGAARGAQRGGPLENWERVGEVLGVGDWLEAAGEDLAERELRRALTSKLLTFPATLARHCQRLGLDEESARGRPARVGVLGARAESTLPPLFWRQLAVLSGLEFHLVFIGPQAGSPREGTSPPPAAEGLWFSSVNGLLHEVQDRLSAPLDAYVLFNSGIGHPKEGMNWEPSVQLLRESGKRALLTSFNEHDLDRDLVALKRHGFSIEHIDRLNPLRSLAAESFEGDQVFFNHSATVVQL